MKWEAITAIGTIILIVIAVKWNPWVSFKRRCLFLWRREQHLLPLVRYEGFWGKGVRFNRKVWNDCHNRDGSFNEKTKRTMGEITKLETMCGMKEIE